MAYKIIDKGDYKLAVNENGKTVASANGDFIEVDGLLFRNLEKVNKLLPYEDWRLSAMERAEDLAKRLSIEEIAGLMMYSPHQMVPCMPGGPFKSTYNGKAFPESGALKWDMTDQQKDFIKNDHVRYVLAMYLENAEVAAKWNNNMQAFAEKEPHGIPINFSSDPRNGAANAAMEYKSEADDVSRWPEGLGMAAMFDSEACREYAEIISKEYRALGISTALSPQIDVGTEPRWMRVEDTFGCSPTLVKDYAKAYCDGMQTTKGEISGWGTDSVSTMAKHWPGGAPCEAGRDAHYPYGKFAVYPGECFEEHKKPFIEGAFMLDGPTRQTAAVMPYYAVSWNQDTKNGKNVGNSYSEYLIKDQLRNRYKYDGVVCTDWGITQDPDKEIDSFGSRCFGVEDMSEAKRHLLAIENGVDQFGGNSNMAPIIEAYNIGVSKYGRDKMDERMRESAVRLLLSSFRCGLFDNPYLDPSESVNIVGCKAFKEAGYKAQIKSVVMVKNKSDRSSENTLPIKTENVCSNEKKKVYIPNRHIDERMSFFRFPVPSQDLDPVEGMDLSPYFERTKTPEEADFAIVFMESPLSDGYKKSDRDAGGNGYLPITLQYRRYTAEKARKESIGGGDFREDFVNRSYAGKTNTAYNESDLDNIINTKKAMGDKKVICVLRMHNSTVPAEFEKYCDAILIEFGVQKNVIFDLITGKAEPSGLLPVQMPDSMETVEAHSEDKPFDMTPYEDSIGNVYQFGFGLNFSGVIDDIRTKKYHV